MASEEERPLGYLNGAFMNPETGKLIGFLVGYRGVLAPAEVEKWNEDYIKVRDAESVAPVLDILRIREYGLLRTFLNGKRVITKGGRSMGRVRDFTFDPTTDFILTLEVSKKFLWIEWNNRQVSYKDIQEVTEKAIVVRTDMEENRTAVKARLPLAT